MFFNPIPGPSPLKWGRVTQTCRRDAKCGYASAWSENYQIHLVALPLLSLLGRGSGGGVNRVKLASIKGVPSSGPHGERGRLSQREATYSGGRRLGRAGVYGFAYDCGAHGFRDFLTLL